MGKLGDMVEEDTRRALDAATSGGAMEQAARQARRVIRARTRKGIDRRGGRFQPYAESTARQKGRFSPVTLEETGKMLGSLSIRTNEDVDFAPSGRGSQLRGSSGRFVSGSSVSFGAAVNLKGSRNRRIGRFHMEGTRDMPQREWFGLTEQEQTRVSDQLGANLESAISREVPEDRRRRVQIKVF